MKKNNAPLGMYLHIPFCLRKCQYCDFCSYPGTDAATRARYVERLCRELICRAPTVAGRPVDTLYFGGGTPTLLRPEDFDRLLATVREQYALTPDAEITAECNPATADEQKLSALRALGINRLSIGAQSVVEEELSALGRLHTFADTVATVEAARRAGFENLSLDVMYGIPHQTEASFAETLSAVLALAPEHLSVYSLIVEPGTPFFAAGDALPLPDEDTVCAMTDQLLSAVRAAGYERYEISNFARPGYHSRHNVHYWNMDDYLGFGPAAHSLLEGVRTGHSSNLEAYLAGENTVEPEEILDVAAERDEYVMLRLRLAAGVNKDAFFARYGEAFDLLYGQRAKPYVAAGFMVDDADHLAFTDRGFGVSNGIIGEILFGE